MKKQRKRYPGKVTQTKDQVLAEQPINRALLGVVPPGDGLCNPTSPRVRRLNLRFADNRPRICSTARTKGYNFRYARNTIRFQLGNETEASSGANRIVTGVKKIHAELGLD